MELKSPVYLVWIAFPLCGSRGSYHMNLVLLMPIDIFKLVIYGYFHKHHNTILHVLNLHK